MSSQSEQFTTPFPRTILEDATRRQPRGVSIAERTVTEGVRMLVDPNTGFRRQRTAELATRMNTTESTLFRVIGRPLFTKLFEQSAASLRDDYFGTRHHVLHNAATELTLDKVTGLMPLEEAVGKWGALYMRIANPAAAMNASGGVFQAIGSQEIRIMLVEQQASVIKHGLDILMRNEGVDIPDRVGLTLYPVLSTLDFMNADGSLDNFAADLMLDAATRG